ncbi:MAG TPA: HDOD domain-containing protein [Opitutaceae bacterium]|nr:HDOD domain-containing protein [Opitutaceae bacterium]
MHSQTTPPSLDEVCSQALRLPCSPVMLPRLIDALQSEDTTAAEIEAIILLDAALAAATLRLANSAALGGRRAVESVEEAILRLGSKEIYRLAALALVNRWGSGHDAALGGEPGDFSRHSLCTAVAAELLAEQSGAINSRTAYTAGLVCHVGKLALAHACAPFYAKIRALCTETCIPWSAAEKAVLGYDQAEASTRLLRAWRFPEALAIAVEFQADPAAAPVEAQPLLAHLHAAHYLAAALGPGVPEEGFLFKLDGEFLAQHGFTSDVIEALMPDLVGRAHARLGDRLTHGAL